jgi:hypothetical protein
VAAAGAAAACGKRGDPLPPLSRAPQAVSDLRVSQRGEELEIAYTTPRATAGGEAILGFVEMELWVAEQAGEFERVAQRTTRRAGPGERLAERRPLPALGSPIRAAVRARFRGEPSQRTPVLTLRVAPAPPAPSELAARLEPQGIALTWTPPVMPSPAATPSPLATPSAGPASPPASPAAAPAVGAPPASPSPSPSPPPPPAPPRFWVYRRASDGAYDRPLTAAPLSAAAFLDGTVQAGERWCYVTRTVVSTEPIVESVPSAEACADYKDVFAPAAPTGLTVLLQEGVAAVSWSPSTEPDLAAYRVYRALGHARAERLAELPAAETVFRDRGLTRGELHVYTVTAVDKAGNESAPSAGAELRLP